MSCLFVFYTTIDLRLIGGTLKVKFADELTIW